MCHQERRNIASDLHSVCVSYEQLDTDEQTATQCYNSLKKLENGATVTFPCCPSLKFCSVECKEVANSEYHTAACGKDFSDVYNHAQNKWGGKAKAGHLTELGKAGFKDDMQSGSYQELSSYIYPSNIPLMQLRVLSVCVQAGEHPPEHPAIAQMVPHVVNTVQCVEGMFVVMGWTLYAHVTGPIKIVQTLGVDVFADPRYDTWVLMTMW